MIYVVKTEKTKETLNEEEFKAKYGNVIDPLYFRGAYTRHVIKIRKDDVEITAY